MVESRSIGEFVEFLTPGRDNVWAFENFPQVIRSAVDYFQPSHLFEVGGGRSPSFSLEEIGQYSVRYTVNDVSQSELDRAPEGYTSTLCADVSKVLPDIECDLIFSRMVFEHIEDNLSNLENQLAILSPGGVAIHFHPVLYSFPFVLNRLAPESLTTKVLQRVHSNRNHDEKPKFPAHYHWCKATEKQRERVLSLGFSDVALVPFWGHRYYNKFPPLHKLNVAFAAELADRDVRGLASYCYTIVQK